MKLTMRPYKTEDDYWRMRDFLRQVTIMNGCQKLNWHVSRLDYWWWFINPDIEKINPEESVFLWLTESDELVAVLNPEGRGQVFLHVWPDFDTPELVEEMVAVAEERLTIISERDGKKKVWVHTDSQDQIRQEILTRRGFRRVERPEVRETQHRRSLDEPLPETPIIPGYTIRPMGDGLELLERCYASGLGFHDDDIHTARKNRDDPSWYRHIQNAPLYRRDLDIVAVAADGSVAAFATVWFDDVSRTACIEPLATVPAHRKNGLAKAVILAGLHRLQRMGCKVVFVSGFSEAANALYFSVMGPLHDVLEPWEKVFESD